MQIQIEMNKYTWYKENTNTHTNGNANRNTNKIQVNTNKYISDTNENICGNMNETQME